MATLLSVHPIKATCNTSGKVILGSVKEIRKYTVTFLAEMSDTSSQVSDVRRQLPLFLNTKYGSPYAPTWDTPDPFCRLRDTQIDLHTDEPGEYQRWIITQNYDNEVPPFTELPPWQMPPAVTGTFVKESREANIDRFGKLLRMSNMEFMEGEPVTREYARLQVAFEWATLNYDRLQWAEALNCVNSREMWGFAPYQVMLSEHGFGIDTWENEVTEGTESKIVRQSYWKLSATFDFRYKLDTESGNTGTEQHIEKDWRRKIPDFGNKVLIPGGNRYNPAHYKPFKDVSGNESPTFLNGAGVNAKTEDEIYFHNVELFAVKDFTFTQLPQQIALPVYDENGNLIIADYYLPGPHPDDSEPIE